MNLKEVSLYALPDILSTRTLEGTFVNSVRALGVSGRKIKSPDQHVPLPDMRAAIAIVLNERFIIHGEAKPKNIMDLMNRERSSYYAMIKRGYLEEVKNYVRQIKKEI